MGRVNEIAEKLDAYLCAFPHSRLDAEQYEEMRRNIQLNSISDMLFLIRRIYELEALALELAEALEWMVDNDETNVGDEPLSDHGGYSWNEINAYWIDGLNKSRSAISNPLLAELRAKEQANVTQVRGDAGDESLGHMIQRAIDAGVIKLVSGDGAKEAGR